MTKGFLMSPRFAEEVTRHIRGSAGSTSAVGSQNAVVDDTGFPAPFSVSWSASEDSWLIYLPDVTKLVTLNGVAITITGGINATNGMPTGYYKISGASGSFTVGLKIDESGVNNSVTASITTNQGIPLAIASKNNDGVVTVKQIVTSAVELVAHDNRSIDLVTDGSGHKWTQIKGWDTATPEGDSSLADMLTADDEDYDASSDAHIPVRLPDKTISYVRIGRGIKGGISVTDTHGTMVEGNAIIFKSASDSNVEVKATGANGVIILEVGVYYV